MLLSELKEHKDDELEGCSLFSNNALPGGLPSPQLPRAGGGKLLPA